MYFVYFLGSTLSLNYVLYHAVYPAFPIISHQHVNNSCKQILILNKLMKIKLLLN